MMLALVTLSTLGTLGQYGALGVITVIVWRFMSKKDRKSYELIEKQNQERKEMYESQSELIKEVTAALVDKNNTDDKMATAVIRLAEEIKEARFNREGNNHETP